MFERFTDRARKVMAIANQEAQRDDREFVDTEHILLGLAKEGYGVAANVLKNLGIDLRKIRVESERLTPAGKSEATMNKLPQTPHAKKVIEYAIEEAKRLGHNYVGTEHLLLGLVRCEDGVASKVLAACGVTVERMRFEVEWLLGVRREEKAKEAAELAMPLLRNILVYVAGPVVKGDLVSNVGRAHEAGMRLMKAGFSVIVPHSSVFWGNAIELGKFKPEVTPVGTTCQDWYGMDLEIVRRCDVLLRLPGEGVGSDMEVAEAKKNNIPVYYSVEDLFKDIMSLPSQNPPERETVFPGESLLRQWMATIAIHAERSQPEVSP